jgi:hypothetical protein
MIEEDMMPDEEDVVVEEDMVEAGEELGEEDALVNPEVADEVAEEQRQFTTAFEAIKVLIAEYADGRGDRKTEALGLAKRWPKLVEFIEVGFAKVRPQQDHGGAFRLGRSKPPMMIEATAIETTTEAWVKKTEEVFSRP